MDAKQLEKVLRYCPHIYKDKAEPFPIRYMGYTVFEKPGYSRSFRNLYLDPEAVGAEFLIEYAIYYDYDIQHLYDLEHIWVAVSPEETVMDCWCSFHGMRLRAAGIPEFSVEGTHPVLYEQPGKHAMMPQPGLFELHPQFHTACNKDAGGGLLIPDMLQDKMHTDEAWDERIRKYILQHFTFEPTMQFEREVLEDSQFIPVEELLDKIPKLVEEQLEIINTCN